MGIRNTRRFEVLLRKLQQMILIAHRGNIDGKNHAYENKPVYIDKALAKGYDAEVDIWYEGDVCYLGHDRPQYKISLSWLEERKDRLWIHCKNIQAMEQMSMAENLHYFWHQEDTLTLTSKKFIWVYPGKQPIKYSIAVMPELYNDELTTCLGICSDRIEAYNYY